MKRFTPIRLLPLLVPALAALTSRAATNEWSFTVTPYLWVASVGLDSSLPDQSPTDPGMARFDTKITAGAMLSAQARYRSMGLFLDFAWLRLTTDALSPGPAYGNVSLRSDFIHSTAALTYQLPLEGKLQAELLAGARLWHVANDFAATDGLFPGFNAASDRTWVDPLVGAALSYDLGRCWSANAKGLVGGFDVAADIAGEVFAGVSRRFSDRCAVTLGYRYLHEEYTRGNFRFNLDTQGFLLGFGFYF
ncbi:MAG: hypothetical protein ACTHLW_12675 [Verrucomicrobiota bacterium]